MAVLKAGEAPAAAVPACAYGEEESERSEGDDVLLSSPTAFTQYVDAIESHLRTLMEAERQCTVEGEQPKAAQKEKAKAREEIVDVWEEEGGLGLGF